MLNAGTQGYRRMPKELREALYRTVKKHINVVRDRIRMSMRKKKTGRIYWIKGKKHRASAPGEAPAILTGRLYRSIVPKMAPSKIQARIMPKVFYAQWLEEGTKNGRILPRPYMTPAFDDTREEFRLAVKRTVERVLKKRAKRRREK